jgi:hypothetical protein
VLVHPEIEIRNGGWVIRVAHIATEMTHLRSRRAAGLDGARPIRLWLPDYRRARCWPGSWESVAPLWLSSVPESVA